MAASSASSRRSILFLCHATSTPILPPIFEPYADRCRRLATSAISASWAPDASAASPSSVSSTSSFTVHNPPATVVRPRSSRRKWQLTTGGDIHNQALYDFRLALTQNNFEKAWTARQELQRLGTLHTIREVGRRDLRKLLERARIGLVSSGGLDVEVCADILVDEEVRSISETPRNTEIVQWMIQFIRTDRKAQAVKIAHQCLAALELQAPESRGKSKTLDPRRENHTDSVSSVKGENSQPDQVKSSDASDITTQDDRLLVPPFFPDMLTLLAFLAEDKDSLLPFFRRLPMPDRTKLWIFSKSRMTNLLGTLDLGKDRSKSNMLIYEQVNRLTPTICAFELAWGLDFTHEQVRSSPLAQLFGDLLAKSNFHALNCLLDALIKGTQGPDAWLRVSGLSYSQQAKVDIDDFVWATLLSGSLSKDRVDIATRVWSHLTSLGLTPSAQVYNALLKGYARLGKWDALVSVWNELVAHRGPNAGPDIFCYTTMISAFFRARRPDDALDLFEDLKAKATGPSGELTITAITYNAVIFGLFMNNQPVRAAAVIDLMLSPSKPPSVPGPNTSTLNTILRAHARSGNLNALMDTLTASQKWNVAPDVITYTTVLDALIRHGAPGSSAQAVTAVHGMMRASNIDMTPVTWTTLLKGLLSDTSSSMGDLWENGFADSATALRVKQEQLLAGMALVDAMVGMGSRPNEVTWTALIQAGCDLQCILNEGKIANEAEVSTRLSIAAPKSRIGSVLTPVASLKETKGSIELLRSHRPGDFFVLSILEALRKDYIQPNRATYHFLLATLLRATPTNPLSPQTIEAARTTFIRGLSLLDYFCAKLFEATSAQPSSPSPSGSSSFPLGVQTLQRAIPMGVELRHLVPPVKLTNGSRKAENPAPEPNDGSVRIIFETLLRRYDALILLSNRLRATALRTSSSTSSSSSSSLSSPSPTGDDAIGLREVEKDILLTRKVMREALMRSRVVNILRNNKHEAMSSDVSNASLAKMKNRIVEIVQSKA